MALPNVNFVGQLDGTTVNELNKKLDYTKIHLDDRKELIDEILNNTNFYQEYFDNYYKVSPNAGDCLSSDINVCKSLERMASYILNSKEVKQAEDAEQTKYVFYTDREYFEKKVAREVSLEGMASAENSDHEETVIHFLKRQDRNVKKAKKGSQRISKKDLERQDELGQVLRDYNNFLEFISSELRNKNSKNNRYILAKTKGSIINDMAYCKDHMLGVFGYELTHCYESTKYDLDIFDFTNKVHLKGRTFLSSKGNPIPAKGLIFFKPNFDPNNEMSYVIMDLQNTIYNAGLTDLEKEVLLRIREGWTQDEIARDLEIYQKKVSRTIDGIVKKIVKVGNKYDLEETKSS